MVVASATRRTQVDSQTALSISMLPGHATDIAAFKDSGNWTPVLRSISSSMSGFPDADGRRVAAEASNAAVDALARAATLGSDAAPVVPMSAIPHVLTVSRISAGSLGPWRARCRALPQWPSSVSRAATTLCLEGRGATGRRARRPGRRLRQRVGRGVDSSAHRGCLDRSGRTVAVLGSGSTGSIRPSTTTWLLRFLIREPLSASLGPGAPPVPEHFPSALMSDPGSSSPRFVSRHARARVPLMYALRSGKCSGTGGRRVNR